MYTVILWLQHYLCVILSYIVDPIPHNLPDINIVLTYEKVFLTCGVFTTGAGDSTDLTLDNIHSAWANSIIDAMYYDKNIRWPYFSSDPNDDETGYNITNNCWR